MDWDDIWGSVKRRVREVKGEHCGETHRGQNGLTWGPLDGCGILAGWGGDPIRKMKYRAGQLRG